MSIYLSAPRVFSSLIIFSICTFVTLAECAKSKPIPFPQGVADPDGSIGYVANGAGSIEALDLLTGKTLWSSNEASRPLLVAKNRLVAGSVAITSKNTLRISVLDTKHKGKLLYHSQVDFPSWVEVGESNDSSFSMNLTLQKHNGDCAVVIGWQAQTQYKGGAPPPKWVQQREAKKASGVVYIDLESGKIETVHTNPTTQLDGNVISLSDQSSWRFERHAREAFAIGPRVYYLLDSPTNTAGQTALRARDLSSGKLLWETTLHNQPDAPPLRPKP